MSNIKFSQLPNLGNITATTTVPVVSAGQNYTVTAANLQAYVNTTTGNVTAGNVVAAGVIQGTHAGSGAQLTNLPAANIVGTVANATFATSAATATTATSATSATTAGTVTTASQPNITSVGTLTALTVSGNITGGNIATGGAVSAVGNITGNYIFGNGSQLTGLPATYSNSNVTSLLSSFGSNTISTTGNITAGNFIGNGSQLTGITANAVIQGNLAGNLQGNGFGANAFSFVSATGNVTGSFIKGNGSELTGVVTSIIAGAGISINQSTGAVTITNTGGGGGNSSVIATNNNFANTNPGGTRMWINGGNATGAYSNITSFADGILLISNGQGNCAIALAADGNISLTPQTSGKVVSINLVRVTGGQIEAGRIIASSKVTAQPVSGNSPFGTNGSLFTPSSSSAAGTTGDIGWDSNFIYVCVAPNSWRRVALSSF